MRTALLITTFNRPEYLKQCLESVAAADLSQVSTVMIVDDCSVDTGTLHMIDEFHLNGVELIKAFSKENRSIKGSLLFGFDILFNTCDVVMNLDGDAIVRRDFVNVLLKLHERFPENILTGFNCLTKNRNGSIRHKVLSEGDGYNKKSSVGGINMLFNKDRYYELVRPAIELCIKQGGNWDHKACLNSTADGKFIICAVPSVVQHIGISSSMGHSAGGEPPDVADDFVDDLAPFKKMFKSLKDSRAKNPNIGIQSGLEWTPLPLISGKLQKALGMAKLQLPNITLVAADCVNLERIFKASDKCTEHIQFADVKIFTSLTTSEPRCENIIPIEPITSKESYSWWIMKELAAHIKTSHLLLFQYDGYVLNADAWRDEWLQYDYIGAPWLFGDPKHPVGNGGFSLRSKKLMDIVANHPDIYPMNEPGVSFQKEEDHVIVRMFGKMLTEKYGIKFAPVEVAEQFAIEAYGVKPPGNQYSGQFGYHGSHVDFSQSNLTDKPY